MLPRLLRLRITSRSPVLHLPARSARCISQNSVRQQQTPSSTTIDVSDGPSGPFIHPEYYEEPVLSPRTDGFGFYPVSLGQKFHSDQYEVIRKLGWGLSSTVWLVRDHNINGFAALKILTANMTRGFRSGRLGELPLMERATSKHPDHPGFKHIVPLLDKFFVESTHGEHACVVTPFLGTTLEDLRKAQPGRRFDLPTVKRITKQVLSALDYLHRECGIVHSDIKPDNILVDHTLQDKAIEELLQDIPSATYPPRIIPEISPDPIVTITSQPIPPSKMGLDMNELSVRLADLGHSHWIDHHFDEDIQPIALRAPEVIIGYPWSTPVDIWTVGCLIFEWLTRFALFHRSEESILTAEELLLVRIMQTTGDRFPLDMLQPSISPYVSTYFAVENGNLQALPNKLRRVAEMPPPHSVEACLQNYLTLEDEDIKDTARFMRRCLQMDPRKRPSAVELLSDNWLQ